MKVLITYGAVPADAPTDEQDVLHEVDAVRTSLHQLGFIAQEYAVSLNLQSLAEKIQSFNPDVIFNMIESIAGKGHLIGLAPLLYENLGLKVTGSAAMPLMLSSNKLLGKRVLTEAGLPTPAWSMTGQDLLPGQWIVKSVWEHASVGLHDDSVMPAPLVKAKLAEKTRHGGQWFAEQYINGREVNVAILAIDGQPHCLPITEIRFIDFPNDKPSIISYAAKWDESTFEYQHTQRQFIDPSQEQELYIKLQQLALRTFNAFELSGYARVDFRIDDEGAIWIIDVNANPCLSKDAGFAAMLKQDGTSYDTAIDHIIHTALSR